MPEQRATRLVVEERQVGGHEPVGGHGDEVGRLRPVEQLAERVVVGTEVRGYVHPPYPATVIEAGTRRRNLPAPPHVVGESLCEPDRDPARPWLILLADEQRPTVLERTAERVVWSTLWPRQPEALIVFDLDRGGEGTDLRWTLLVDERPDDSRLNHYRKRLNLLINANLRYTYGQ